MRQINRNPIQRERRIKVLFTFPPAPLQSLRRGQGSVLWLGPAAEEVHHAGGERQDEPMGAEHH